MQHSQTECFKKTLNQSGSAKKIHGCPGAFTYITAQIVKERSVLTSSEDRNQQTGFQSADFWHRSWWSQPGSNRRPLACKASALPAELWPPRLPFSPITSLRVSQQRSCTHEYTPLLASPAPRPRRKIRREMGAPNPHLILVGLGGFEPPTPRLSSVCSNQLSYRPEVLSLRDQVMCVSAQVSW